MCDDNDDVPDATPTGSEGDSTDARGFGGSVGSYSLPQYQVNYLRPGESPDTYNMSYPRRGLAIVINNENFMRHTDMSRRSGTSEDARRLVDVFSALGFQVERYDDVTIRVMTETMFAAARFDHSNSDCFACAILSHGDKDEIYGIDGKIQLDELMEPFKGGNCLSLAGKPKLFFIQACRGDKLDHGVEVADAEGDDDVITMGSDDEMDAGPVIQRIPAEADFLMAYSVVPGYFSWRNSTRGSWFIQALCRALEEYGQQDILKIMTRVCRMVAYDYESNAAKEYMTRKKQIPCITSMLTKDLYFTKK